MPSLHRQAALISTVAGPVHVIVHRPDSSVRLRDTAVLLLPPFGWDDVCSYRPRRDWADDLAAGGYVTVRLTYPASGDSGGTPGDAALVDAWTSAVKAIASWTRETFERPRLAVIAIEFSGLIACQAITAGMTAEDLALWAVPATGRQFVRRMQAFSNLEATSDSPAADPVGDGTDGISAGGFRISEATVAALLELDIAGMDGLQTRLGRVLLLGRDQMAPDARLRARFVDSPAQVTRGGGGGYAAMTAPSFEAVTPRATIDEVHRWLDQGSAPRAAPLDPPELSRGPVGLGGAGHAAVQETQLTLAGPTGSLSGVLTEPAGGATVDQYALFLDTGTIRQIGPSRLWVEAARRWGAAGLPSVRFDLDGLGDSDGDSEPYRDLSKLYDPWLVAQVSSVMDQLQAELGAQRFVIVGLSAGAYWALQSALQDHRVTAIAMINPGTLIWSPGTSALGDYRTLRTIAQTRSISLATLRKAFGQRGLALAIWLLRAAVGTLIRRGASSTVLVGRDDEMREAVTQLQQISADRLLVFCDEEPVLGELGELGLIDGLSQAHGVHLVRIATNDHTVRPLWAQRELHAALDGLLARVTGEPVTETAAPEGAAGF